MPSEEKRKRVAGDFQYIIENGRPPSFFSGVVSLDYRSRNWQRQPRPHVNTLPYYDQSFRQVNGEYQYERLDFPPGAFIVGGYPQESNHSFDWVNFTRALAPNDLSDRSKLKLLNKVSDAHWDAPVWAAELGETTEMILSTAKKLAKAGSQLRKKQFKKCADTLGLSMKSLAGPKDNWMSYRYGWIPAIGDCCDMAETFAKTLSEKPDSQRFFAAAGSDASGVTEFFWFSGFQHRHLTTYEASFESKAWLTLARKYPALIALEDYGLVNWPANAYNLVPLSWVVDWAYPIGDYLQAQTTLLGYEVLDGGCSTLLGLSGNTVQTPNWYERGAGPSAQFSGRLYQRERWSGEISLFPPAPDLSMNWKRCIDAASLLHNVFGPIVKR